MQIASGGSPVPLLKRLALPVLTCAALTLGGLGTAAAQAQAEELSLITPTPEAGFALAVKLSRKGVAVTQRDPEVRGKLRPVYANNADSLIAVSQVIAIHYQTIAAANNYWRK